GLMGPRCAQERAPQEDVARSIERLNIGNGAEAVLTPADRPLALFALSASVIAFVPFLLSERTDRHELEHGQSPPLLPTHAPAADSQQAAYPTPSGVPGNPAGPCGRTAHVGPLR